MFEAVGGPLSETYATEDHHETQDALEEMTGNSAIAVASLTCETILIDGTIGIEEMGAEVEGRGVEVVMKGRESGISRTVSDLEGEVWEVVRYRH